MSGAPDDVIREVQFLVGQMYPNDVSEIVANTIDALREAGFRIVHPESMLQDCPDRWTCCIHERPENP